MALPSSGTLSIGDIRSELSNTGTSPFSLAKAGEQYTATREDGYTPLNQNSTSKPNNSSPYQISEWYSYNHSENGSCGTTYTTPSVSAPYIYYRINITGISGAPSVISVTMNSYSVDTFYVQFFSSYPFSSTGSLTGTPLTTLTFTSNGTQTYTYTMTSTSDVVYIVCWDNSIL